MALASVAMYIDEDVKKNAQKILSALNMSMSEAIALYLAQITLHKGIPFEVKIPNELTAKTLREAEAGQGLRRAADVEELFKELNS